MKKKILSLIMVLACASTCAVALVACGGGNDSNGGGAPSVNATVTETEWKDAFDEVQFTNLTYNYWQYKDVVTDIDNVVANKQNAESIETFKSAKKGSDSWFYVKYTSSNPDMNDYLYMFKVYFANSGLSTSGGVHYSYEPDISKWTQETLDNGVMDMEVERWARIYYYNILMEKAIKYGDFTYDKSGKVYRDGDDSYAYEVKFKDKKIVSITCKTTNYSYEFCDFGTTVIDETPTTFATLAEDAIGKTFRLTDVVACEDNNDPSTDKPSTDQAALDMAAQFKTDNLNKTAVCEAQELDDVNMDGVLKGTCNFGNGAFDSLTGDNVLYWKASEVYLYSARITIATKDNSVRLTGKYFADVLTLKLDLGNGNYLKLTYSL